MKLIVIYGPPAVGKLTVAKELANMTDYKLLHNHLVIDFVNSLIGRESPKFWELIDTYRLDLIDKASEQNVKGIIITSVNIKGKDDEFIKSLINTVEKNSGQAHFVRLKCDMTELKNRLTLPSRMKHGKLMDPKIFDEFTSKNKVFSSIDFVESFEIDNTNIPPKETAAMIKGYFDL